MQWAAPFIWLLGEWKDKAKGLLAMQPSPVRAGRASRVVSPPPPTSAEKVLQTPRWTSVLIWKWTACGKIVSFYMLSLSRVPGDEIFKVTVHFRAGRKEPGSNGLGASALNGKVLARQASR